MACFFNHFANTANPANVDRKTYKQEVAGSSPALPTNPRGNGDSTYLPQFRHSRKHVIYGDSLTIVVLMLDIEMHGR
jgi:hypothetical protein